jgi:6-pyruvoyltetrahydropterin/6-carboxytetrahydropterin synthase
VHVAKDYLQFCAAHCISQENGACERLHGHNYRVAVTLWGDLIPNAHYVFDFITLKAIVRRLVNEWDHRVLLATENPLLPVTVTAEEVSMTTPSGGRYLFPRRDVYLLPIPNTTAEMLAAYLVARLREEIRDTASITMLEVEVEETPGQSATFTDTTIS